MGLESPCQHHDLFLSEVAFDYPDSCYHQWDRSIALPAVLAPFLRERIPGSQRHRTQNAMAGRGRYVPRLVWYRHHLYQDFHPNETLRR